jgi:4-amino-4-deoxy-L-arabinose transferase-like glycosyltransferase
VCLRWLRPLRWVAIAWIVVFWRLGYLSLLDPDEAHYAELTREMARAGSWFVPLLDGHPFIDKPVLFHWLQASAVALAGETEFAVRLPSALAAIALVAVTRWAGRALVGERVGDWGAIMFATIPATFALSSVALFDMVFTAFLFSAVACWLVGAARRSRRIEYIGYALLTLATMTKGPVAVLLAALLFAGAYALGGDARERVSRLHWIGGLAATLVLASPWFVWMYFQFGDRFVNDYVLAGNLWYFTQPVPFSSRVISHTFYVRAFAGGFFPWTIVMIGRGVDALRRRADRPPMDVDEKLLWLWTAVVIGFFTLARFKLDHYIYPAAPACCLLAARGWRDAVTCPPDRTRATRVAIFAIGAVMIVGGAFFSVFLFDVNLELPATAILLPVVIGAGGILLLTHSRLEGWTPPPTAGIPAVALLSVYAVVVTIGFPTLERVRPIASVGHRLHDNVPADGIVGLYRLERWRASIRYYADRPIERLETPDDVRAFVARGVPAYLVMLRREYDALRRAGVPLHQVLRRRCVVGTSGRGIRRQRWGYLVVVTNRRPRGPWTPLD